MPIPLPRAWPLLVLAALLACGKDEPTALTRVPVYPGATLRPSESRFQQRLLSLLLPEGTVVPEVEIYETSAAFGAVLAFYETYFAQGSSARPFAVAGRMRELAERARSGATQPLEVGRLVFGRGGGERDSLSAGEVADSLSALSQRFSAVQGTIALGRIPLATAPPSVALISIEHPHLNTETLSVDSLTVFTIAVQPRAPAPPR